MSLTLPLVFFMIVAIILVAKSVIAVPRGKVFVISSLGRPTRVLSAGLHFVPPFVTRIAARIPADEQTLDVPETGTSLRDGTPMVVKGTIRYRVTNPMVAVTDVADYQQALAEVARTHWKRALETTSDVVRVQAALATALPAIRSAAASWGIEAIDAETMTTMSEDGVRRLEQQAALEREQRVVAWLGERGEAPGPDGRPTAAQHAAYKAWSEQLVADHRAEIDAAMRAAAARDEV